MNHEATKTRRVTKFLAAGIVVLALVGILALRVEKSRGPSRLHFAATVHPLAAILREIAGDRAEIVQLLSPAASPHTYEPRPSDLRITENATALFFVHRRLDGWAASLPAKERIEVFNLLPPDRCLKMVFEDADEAHSSADAGEGAGGDESLDAHFWTDPLTVKATLPALCECLSRLDPDGASIYQSNSRRFVDALDLLDAQLKEILLLVKGRPVFLFHPSFQYLLKRYGLVFAGSIEPFPGKEPSPKYLQEIVHRLRDAQAKAIFTEPQLSPRPAQVVAEAAGLKLFELDPNGGVEGRETYAELMLYNARKLREALE